MQEFMVVLKRKKGTTKQQFRDHYENNHIPLGSKFIGHLLVGFKRHYPGPMTNFAGDEWEEGRLGGGADECAYDAISVYKFRDEAAIAEMKEILSDPEIQRTLIEDENRFLDRANCLLGLCDVVEGAGMVAGHAEA